MFSIEKKDENVTYFYCTSPSGGLEWQAFHRKKGVKFYTFICIGGGGAGGNGFSGSAGTARGGGGGGGTGAISRLRIAAHFLPDTIYMNPGKGGIVGGTATGEVSTIALTDRISAINQPGNILLRSGATVAGAGGNGTAAAAGALGGASTIETTSGSVFSAWGEFIGIAGQAGVAGGLHTGQNGNFVSAFGLPITPGAGGGGVTTTNFAGGNIITANAFLFPTRTGGTGGGANAGDSGLILQYPLRMIGGAGGGTNNSGTGGRGGNGAFGCGGGGGGAGVTGGVGGNGGDGLIIVIEEY